MNFTHESSPKKYKFEEKLCNLFTDVPKLNRASALISGDSDSLFMLVDLFASLIQDLRDTKLNPSLNSVSEAKELIV